MRQERPLYEKIIRNGLHGPASWVGQVLRESPGQGKQCELNWWRTSAESVRGTAWDYSSLLPHSDTLSGGFYIQKLWKLSSWPWNEGSSVWGGEGTPCSSGSTSTAKICLQIFYPGPAHFVSPNLLPSCRTSIQSDFRWFWIMVLL